MKKSLMLLFALSGVLMLDSVVLVLANPNKPKETFGDCGSDTFSDTATPTFTSEFPRHGHDKLKNKGKGKGDDGEVMLMETGTMDVGTLLPVGGTTTIQVINLGGTIAYLLRGNPTGQPWSAELLPLLDQATLGFSGGPTNSTASITNIQISTTEDKATYTIAANSTLSGEVTLHVPGINKTASATFKIMDFASVEWVGLDGNFESAGSLNGGGFRIFPEKNSPNDEDSHNVVGLKVTMTGTVAAGHTLAVYWKIVDVDDPTQDFYMTGIGTITKIGTLNAADTGDTSTTTFAGGDNRKSGGGTGIGIAPASGVAVIVGGSISSIPVLVAITDPMPGNNWKIVVAASETERDAIVLNESVPNGQNKDGTNPMLSFKKSATGGTLTANQQSSLLSVWRTLHVEVDSMSTVTGNLVGGKITAITPKVPIGNVPAASITVVVTSGTISGTSLDDGSPNLSASITSHGRFEAGSISVGIGDAASMTTGLDGNGNNFFQKAGTGINIPVSIRKAGKNPVNGRVSALVSGNFMTITSSMGQAGGYVGGTISIAGVTLSATGNPLTITANGNTTLTVIGVVEIPFVAHDDDNDTRLPFPNPPLDGLVTAMEEAYVKVVNDGGGSITNNGSTVPFVLNVENNASLEAVRDSATAFQSIGSRSEGFWIVWLCSAFQPGAKRGAYNPADVRGDGDPHRDRVQKFPSDPNHEEPLIANTVFNTGTTLPPCGALLFLETFYDWGVSYYPQPNATILMKQLIAHELGHAFDLDHPPDGSVEKHSLMGNFWETFSKRFSPTDINKIRYRVKSPGTQQP